MATLEGKNICDTYKSILNIGNQNNEVLPANGSARCIVRDSLNTSSSLEIGTAASAAGIKAIGNSCIAGALNISGNITQSGSSNITTGTGGLRSCGCALIAGQLENTGVFKAHTSGTDRFIVCSTCTKTSNNTCVGGTLNVCGNTTVSGTVRATGDVIAFTSSDKALKNDLNKICNTKDILNNLNGYSFEWNEKSEREGRDLGVVAQEVKEVLPDIVKERDNGYLAVDYIKIIPILIEEVKRLNREIEELKK